MPSSPVSIEATATIQYATRMLIGTYFAKPLSGVIYYAVGLDMTRRDLQNEMKKQGRPWEVGKAFDHSAPIGPLHPLERTGELTHAAITLDVNGERRPSSDIRELIWNVAETIEHLSGLFELQPGDLIYTGTPEGVGAVGPGDTMVAAIEGLGELRVRVG